MSRQRPYRRVLRPLFAAVLVLAAHADVHAQQVQRTATWQGVAWELEAKLRADAGADSVGSIAAGIVIGDSLVWSTAVGWADRDRRIAADAHTIYRIGSISKSFTAMLLAQQATRGTLSLDDAVERYLPEVRGFANARAGAAPITLRQLATHTAGLIREPRLAGAASGPIAGWEEKILASIPATSFDTVPGARYSYSNIGFGVLGLAVSRAAGAPFIELIERDIFRPLQMTSSTFVITDALRPRLSVGYANGNNRVDAETPALEHAGRGYKVPNGGIYSTVPDLARFIAAMTGASTRTLLSEAMRAEMMRVQTPENPRNGYGLGFSVRVLDGGSRIVGHGGSVAGYTAHLAFDPDRRIGVILLRNYNRGRTNLQTTANEVLLRLAGGS